MEKVSIRQSNKGFTLVEICVVLLLITILATITTLSLISWQEYSINKKMDDNAELIYMAAKNKIAQLKSDNTFEELKNWGNLDTNLSYTNKYHLIGSNNASEKIYYFLCNKDDYLAYNKGNLSDVNKKLMFDLLKDYLHDKKLLKANIAIEYGIDGTIYAVYYSDRTSFGYGTSNAYNLSSSQAASQDKRYEKVVGLYSIK